MRLGDTSDMGKSAKNSEEFEILMLQYATTTQPLFQEYNIIT